ncbi:MAG: hypothetical protein HZA46_09880 [Planctomycetales bacterium]|nr:hypothetical protein [Planctomycetales bacterium]
MTLHIMRAVWIVAVFVAVTWGVTRGLTWTTQLHRVAAAAESQAASVREDIIRLAQLNSEVTTLEKMRADMQQARFDNAKTQFERDFAFRSSPNNPMDIELDRKISHAKESVTAQRLKLAGTQQHVDDAKTKKQP